MAKWLNTQFGRLTLASTLALLAFPFLYQGSFGDQGLAGTVGFILLGAGMAIPLITIRKKE